MPSPTHVLLVDDDVMNVGALRRIFEFDGIAVTAVASAEDALRALAERPYQAVLTDLRLPGISGQELARRMRQTRLIALSGDVLAIERSVCFDAAFRKPCDPDLVVQAILAAGPRGVP